MFEENAKAKSSLGLSIMPLRRVRGMELNLHAFITSALDE
jgi:hypothetical protein